MGLGRLRIIREAKKITLDALGAMTGYSKGYLSRIETNERVCSVVVAKKIADALKVKVDELL